MSMTQENESAIEEPGELAAAREKYRRDMEDIRRILFNTPHVQKSQRVREQAELYLEQVKAIAFNLGIAPRQGYPRFQTDTLFAPTIYPIWGPNPDFIYAWVWLDGACTYRITGCRNDSLWGSFQTMSEFWGDPKQRQLSELPFDDMDIAADGTFEIWVSAEPRKGNWIPLDANSENNYIFLRRTVVDWAGEKPAEVHIEFVDGDRGTLHMDQATLARRIARAGEMLKNATSMFSVGLIGNAIDKVGMNNILCVNGRANRDDGYHPGADYLWGAFALNEAEALIIEIEWTGPKYWGFHLTDIWLQVTDYVFHQSSLNVAQARVDRDGKYRFVISAEDPGVPNWLDPVGNSYGGMQGRSYDAATPPTVATRVVPSSRVREYLPLDTPTVSAAERMRIVNQRARSILRHYNA
jgi:hypothetical protein